MAVPMAVSDLDAPQAIHRGFVGHYDGAVGNRDQYGVSVVSPSQAQRVRPETPLCGDNGQQGQNLHHKRGRKGVVQGHQG
jgi:hypothetical protein